MARSSKRAEVFSVLDKAGRAGKTLHELSSGVPCSEKTARVHLTALLDAGTVRRDRLEPDGETRGQPPYVYFLSKFGAESVG